MNKTKKIVTAVVATVMAGTMVVSLAACGKKTTIRNITTSWDQEPTLEESLKPALDENGKLTYTKDSITLHLAVGNSNTQTIAFTTGEMSGTWKFPDGKSYQAGTLKSAWQGLADQLGVSFTDGYTKQSKSQIADPANAGQIGQYAIVTGSLADAVTYSNYLLDLNNYVYYMPNYKAFLEANPVTTMSLTATGTGGSMYAAPYFDGNDDIEKYEIIRRDWVSTILDTTIDASKTTTYKAQAEAKLLTGTSASATSYMGQTGSWTVETTDPSDETKTTTLKVDYDAALTAAKDSTTNLGKALADAGVTNSSLTSGNIVDLQNAAITAKSGEVTGAQLTAILQAYVDVAYTTASGAKFYTTRSDVFNSAAGGWDVDLLVGLLRCIVTSNGAFKDSDATIKSQNLYGIISRVATTQRRVDITALAGELYGVRGMEDRLSYADENVYIDSQGNLKDSRQDAQSYELLNNMSKLAAEGLLYTGEGGTDGKNSFYQDETKPVAAMTHDYAQTQTRFTIEGATNTSTVPTGYDFAPIVTPVSKWDVDGDGQRTDIMRFTESWRSVKNTGFVVPKEYVEGKPEVLSAVLSLIDYMFSSDGQILMTYGQQATSKTATDGWWYGTESTLALNTVATESVAATNYSPAQYTVKDEYKQQVFVYNGKVYEGLQYADRNVPIMTDASKSFYLGGSYDGHTADAAVTSGTGKVSSVVGNYTNYARQIIGTTLPIGNKDQGFEYQCTAANALAGAKRVATAINNGTIKHVMLQLTSDDNLWYLCVPTMVPMSPNDSSTITDQKVMSALCYNNSSTSQITNVYIDIEFYGLGADKNICGISDYGKMKTSGAAYVEFMNSYGLDTRVQIFSDGWEMLDEYYGFTGLRTK